MPKYHVEIAMESMRLIKALGKQGDDVWIHMEANLHPTSYALDGSLPVLDHQEKNVHWMSRLSSGEGFSPALRGVRESFFSNQKNPAKDPIIATFDVSADQVVTVSWWIQNLSHEAQDPDAAEEEFWGIVDTVRNVIASGSSAAAPIPVAGPIITLVGGAIATGLAAAGEFFNPGDEPPVNCDGLIATGSIAKNSNDLIAMNGQTKQFPWRGGAPAPKACGGGSDVELLFSIKVNEVPEFLEVPSTWDVRPVTGIPRNVWLGRWADNPSPGSIKIRCSISDREIPRPNLPPLHVTVFEIDDETINGEPFAIQRIAVANPTPMAVEPSGGSPSIGTGAGWASLAVPVGGSGSNATGAKWVNLEVPIGGTGSTGGKWVELGKSGSTASATSDAKWVRSAPLADTYTVGPNVRLQLYSVRDGVGVSYRVMYIRRRAGEDSPIVRKFLVRPLEF